MVELEFGPTTTKKIGLHTTTLVVEEWNVTSMIIPPTGAIRGVETSSIWNIMERLAKSNCLIQILSLENLFRSYIVTTNKIEPKKVNYNHCKYSQVHLVGYMGK